MTPAIQAIAAALATLRPYGGELLIPARNLTTLLDGSGLHRWDQLAKILDAELTYDTAVGRFRLAPNPVPPTP